MMNHAPQIQALFRKEIRHLVFSPASCFSALFFMLGTSVPFLASGASVSATATAFRQFVSIIPYVSAVVLAALTMGLWSDEEKSGTREIILSYPISEELIVAMKFFAVLALYTGFLVLTVPVVALGPTAGTAQRFIHSGGGSILAAYSMMVLSGASYVAAGLFFSVLFKNAAASFFSTSAFLAAFSWLSFSGHFEAACRGMLDSRDVVFYLSACAVALYAACLVLSLRRNAP